MLKSLFNKVAFLKTCKFIKKTLQHRCHEKETAEAVVRRYSSKKVFLKISQISQESCQCWSLFLGWRSPTLLSKIFKNTFLQNTYGGYFWNQTYASAAVLLHIRIGNLDCNESHEKKAEYIHASAADLLHIRIGNLDWCKCRHCKNEAREIDCLCCREVNAMLIASAKIPEREGSISPCRLYG